MFRGKERKTKSLSEAQVTLMVVLSEGFYACFKPGLDSKTWYISKDTGTRLDLPVYKKTVASLALRGYVIKAIVPDNKIAAFTLTQRGFDYLRLLSESEVIAVRRRLQSIK